METEVTYLRGKSTDLQTHRAWGKQSLSHMAPFFLLPSDSRLEGLGPFQEPDQAGRE